MNNDFSHFSFFFRFHSPDIISLLCAGIIKIVSYNSSSLKKEEKILFQFRFCSALELCFDVFMKVFVASFHCLQDFLALSGGVKVGRAGAMIIT